MKPVTHTRRSRLPSLLGVTRFLGPSGDADHGFRGAASPYACPWCLARSQNWIGLGIRIGVGVERPQEFP